MQWFAEEGAADEAARTGDTAPDAGEQEDFAALIRGRYKADFDARVQKILDGRLRGLRQENARRAMAYSAKRATRQAARSIASVGRRPAENGGRCVGVTGSDPRGLTSRELADIRRRVMEGEKISF